MNTAIYARVSTEEQADGNSLDSQVESCRHYADYQVMNVTQVFRDSFTGARIDRPELQKLLKLIVTGEIGAVIVYDSSRWSRDIRVTLELQELFIEYNCELHYSTRGKIEFEGDGETFNGIEAYFNMRWKKEIQKYTSNGRNEKALRDKVPVMAGYPPFGYRKVGKGEDAYMEIEPDDIEIVRSIFKWYVYGDEKGDLLSLRAIAIKLNESGILSPHYPMNPNKKRQPSKHGWIISTIRGILVNEIYAGVTYYGKTRIKRISPTKAFTIVQPRDKWIRIEVPHLAIIDRTTFELAQQRRETNIQLSRRNQKHEYLLSGFFRCGGCNRVMGGNHLDRSDDYMFYRCTNHDRLLDTEPCPIENKTIAADIVESAVWNWLVGLWSDEDAFNEGIEGIRNRNQSELEPKRNQIDKLRNLAAKQQDKATRLISQLSDADDPLIVSMIKDEAKKALEIKAEFENDARILENELANLDISPEMLEEVRNAVAMVRTGMLNPSFETKRAIFDRLNLKVVYRIDNSGRWLDVSCGLKPEGDAIPLRAETRNGSNYVVSLLKND